MWVELHADSGLGESIGRAMVSVTALDALRAVREEEETAPPPAAPPPMPLPDGAERWRLDVSVAGAVGERACDERVCAVCTFECTKFPRVDALAASLSRGSETPRLSAPMPICAITNVTSYDYFLLLYDYYMITI